jgi:hypothetical protein
MSDDCTLGTDTSSYQPLGTYDPNAFEIVNCQDPELSDKAARNVQDGRPWSIYVWVYPGESATSLCDRLQEAIAAAGSSPTLLDGWWDYEEPGVEQWQLDQVFEEADRRGLRTGYYANPGLADDQKLAARPFWMAQYPYPNDGTFRGFDEMTDPGVSVQLWQFTSTSGTLDQNAVADQAWYVACAGARPVPQGAKDADMYVMTCEGFAPVVVDSQLPECYEVSDAGTAPCVAVDSAQRQYIIDDVRAKGAAKGVPVGASIPSEPAHAARRR